jgi:hypothetical protein
MLQLLAFFDSLNPDNPPPQFSPDQWGFTIHSVLENMPAFTDVLLTDDHSYLKGLKTLWNVV